MKTLKVKRKKEKKRNVDLYRSASGMILAAKNGKQTPSDLNIESYLCFTDVQKKTLAGIGLATHSASPDQVVFCLSEFGIF